MAPDAPTSLAVTGLSCSSTPTVMRSRRARRSSTDDDKHKIAMTSLAAVMSKRER